MPAITSDLIHRARGCLLGAAVGDAFAMPLEGAPRPYGGAQCREMRAGRLEAGRFTAATEQMLTTALQLLDAQWPLAEKTEARGRKEASPPAGAGKLTLLARLGRKPSDALPVEATAPDPAVLTRCLPLALAYIGDRDACIEQARQRTALTHSHPDCLSGSAFTAVLLWQLLRGVAPNRAVPQSLRWCGEISDALAETIQNAPGCPRERLTNGSTVAAVLESVVWGLSVTASYQEAVTRVANLGGPFASTAGALIGAFAGAAYRFSGVPADWRAQLHGVWPLRGGRTWRDADLAELGERLVQHPIDQALARA